MNPRVLTGVTGTITVALGLAALFYPDRVMGFLGFTTVNTASSAAVLGEIRATYGGLFTVVGIFTLLSVMDPMAHRGRLTLLGSLWLGSCAGRLLGASLDGGPGLFGWLSVAFELLMGAALLAACWLPSSRSSSSAQPPAYTPPAYTPPPPPVEPSGASSPPPAA